MDETEQLVEESRRAGARRAVSASVILPSLEGGNRRAGEKIGGVLAYLGGSRWLSVALLARKSGLFTVVTVVTVVLLHKRRPHGGMVGVRKRTTGTTGTSVAFGRFGLIE